MKYIRTKNDISIIETTLTDNKELFDYLLQFSNYKDNLIKVSDSIEELCDEFVLDHPLFGNNCKCLYHSFEKAKNGIKKRTDDAHDTYDFNIYGAIWTSKGLIYVAKMNDKGELELI